MRIATVNVNGIRAAWRKGMPQWLTTTAPDIVLLQEVRAPINVAEKLFQELGETTGDTWHVAVHPCAIPGRAGVAIASRGRELTNIRADIDPNGPAVDTGRWLQADVATTSGTLTLVSAYLHSGQVGTEKQEQKMAHLAQVDAAMQALINATEAGASEPFATNDATPQFALVSGDLNIVAGERDIKNWKGNHNKTAGVLDEEIAHVTSWLQQGWVDVVRAQAGDIQGPYSWWSWRGKAFDNDAGWRIDYQLATPQLAEVAANMFIDRAPAYDQRWSDHAPVVVDYDLD